MKLTVHRGANQIGGTCIELQARNTRIFLDCGLPLPNPVNEKATAEEQRLLIPGLFEAGPPAHGILLSHAHPDHFGLIQQTDPSLPVFATRMCFKMAMTASLFANQPSIEKIRQNILKLGVRQRIGNLSVTAYPVDHSIAGSCAFLIESDDKRLLYTGDLRFHGRKPGMRSALLRASRRASIDLTITEGTTLGRSDSEAATTETEIEIKGAELVARRDGLVAAQFSPLNLDRLVTFLRISRKVGRLFVIDPYAAFVLHLARSEGVRVPNPFCSSSGIRILIPHGFWESRAGRAIARHRSKMEATVAQLPKILNRPGRFLILWRPSMRRTVFEGSLPPGTLCIRSFWKGYLDSEEEKTLAEEFTAGGVEQQHLHASGHASRSDLVQFLKELDSRRIIVVHSDVPEALQKEFSNADVAEDGVPIMI